MSIESIKKLLRVSTKSESLINWQKIQDEIGLGLPSDYKEFIETYGAGQIDGFLWIFSPFSSNENLNLIKQIILQTENLKILSEDFDGEIAFATFPETNSLFPFGMTDNGDTLFWKVSENPDKWQIVINESRSPEFEKFNLSFVEFMEKILTKEITSRAFPPDFPLLEHSFRAT